jgi:hypothetical protein
MGVFNMLGGKTALATAALYQADKRFDLPDPIADFLLDTDQLQASFDRINQSSLYLTSCLNQASEEERQELEELFSSRFQGDLGPLLEEARLSQQAASKAAEEINGNIAAVELGAAAASSFAMLGGFLTAPLGLALGGKMLLDLNSFRKEIGQANSLIDQLALLDSGLELCCQDFAAAKSRQCVDGVKA